MSPRDCPVASNVDKVLRAIERGGDALDIIPKLDEVFDMVFIDADKNEYLEYLRIIEAHLQAGSTVVADNTDISTFSLRKYVDYVRNSGKYESHAMRVQWGEMEVSVKL